MRARTAAIDAPSPRGAHGRGQQPGKATTLGRARAGAAALLLVGGGLALVGVPRPAVAHDHESCFVDLDFDEVGEHEFEVPAGLDEITLDVFGAQGGNLPAGQNPGTGGLGAGATGAVIAVTPGEILGVFVGGKADDVGGGVNSPETPGGFNGGGDGGVMVDSAHGGAGGGGASDVRRGTDRLVIAGGGGGGSHGGSGGHGGQVGEDGDRGPTATGSAVPGGGASQAAGGTGGAGDTTGSGVDGAQFQGGAGGGGTASIDGGGGGGGGFFGGGGAGGGAATVEGGGAGGGGGSSSGPAGTVFATGVQAGDGLVSISYTEPECTDLSITKTPSDTVVNVGSTVDYTVVVTNEGPGDATGVTVTDDLPGQLEYVSDTCGGANVPPWTWAVGALASGNSAACTITATVVAAGTIVNTSVVGGDQRDPTPENNQDTAEIYGPSVDLAIAKTPSVDTATVGDTVSYTLVVTNDGPDDATGVTVTDDVPGELQYVSDTCGGANVPPWTWAIGDLAAGDSVDCVLTVTVVAAGTIVNIAIVESDQSDPNPDNSTDTAGIVASQPAAQPEVVSGPPLAFTGADPGALLAVGLATLSGGGLLVMATRRRRSRIW